MTSSDSQSAPLKAPALCSQRWNLSILCFFGFLVVYVVRVNLSVAIICMVRAPRLNVTSDRHMGPRILDDHEIVSERSTLFLDVTSASPYTSKDESSDSDCSLESTRTTLFEAGEFDWDKGTQTRLLSMYFYGYIFTQIPGGWLAGRYGGRRVWGICQAICALCTLATPLAARANVYLVYALRFLLGLAAGVSFPCVHSMMGRWAPKLERSKLVSFGFTGLSVGNVLTFSLSALLCVYGFDNGWGSIFYLAGLGNLLWVVVWFVVTADTPAKHKWISEVERNYILNSIGETPEKKERLATPWRAMFTSAPVWACVSAHMLHNYTNYTLLTSLPTFMKEVLRFDIKQNGGLSALPYLCQAVMSALSGQVADRLREKGILSTKNTRKLFQILAFVGSAICIVSAGYMTCAQRPLAVFLLCLCLSFDGLNRAGFAVNHIDLAPRHAGVLYGITNTAGTIPGMISPMVVGALTPNRTAEEWRHVFFLCSALAILGAILFAVFADGELQSWAVPPAAVEVVEYIKEKNVRSENPEHDTTMATDKSLGEVTLDSVEMLSKVKLNGTFAVSEGNKNQGIKNPSTISIHF